MKTIAAPNRLTARGAVNGSAVELGQDLRFRFARRAFRAPIAGELRVRVEWAGICGSDLHVARTGRWVTDWPAVLGHEFFGHVDAVGENVDLAPGTPVVADSRIACGACAGCAASPAECVNLAFVGEACAGGFATHCLLPASSVVTVPLDLDGAIAALAEPLACALHALGHLGRVPERVAILGHGPLGALVHLALRDLDDSIEIAVAEPLELRAELALALGAELLPEDASDGVFDAVFDVAGYAGSLGRAVSLCAVGGDVVVVALASGQEKIGPSALVEREVIVRGSHAFRDELPTAVTLLASAPWRFRPLVTDAVELDQLPRFLETELTCSHGVKALVKP